MPATQKASQRIVAGTLASLQATFVDQDGDPRTPGTVTVHVVRDDGTQVLPAGTATTLLSDEVTVSVGISNAQSTPLDILTATWTEQGGATVVTVVETVGGRYFTLQDARLVDPILRDTAKFPDEDLKRVRNEVELELERITGRSFVPRYRSQDGDAGSVRTSSARAFQLTEVDVRAVRWVKINGVAYASTYWELTTGGRLYFGRGIGLLPQQVGNGPWRGNLPVVISVGYEFGWWTPPDDLKRAMLTRLRSRLIDGNQGVPDRATAMTVDGTTFSLSTPGQRGAHTGIPSVDDVYDSYTRHDWQDDNMAGSVRII